MRIPDYVLIQNWNYHKGFGTEPVPFEAGSFMRPIDIYYLPKHIVDSNEYKWHDPDKEYFCYTSIGIIPVPKHLLRKI